MERSTTERTGNSKKRFGVFEFDQQARELTKHGIRLKLQEQPIQVLAVLLEQAGQIVPREELQRRLWPDGTFVDYEQSLNKAVNKLREALGDSADHPIYIETLARRGYRFVAPVECDRAVGPTVQAATPRRKVRTFLAAGGLGTALVLGTGIWPIDMPQVERVVPLTNDATNKNLPLFSDGTRVWYSDGQDIWSVATSGGEPRRVTLPFTPDRELALTGYSHIQQQILLSYLAKTVYELWLMGPEGETPRKICEIEPPLTVALAPEAERLALGLSDGIYIQSIATGKRKRIRPMKWVGPSTLWWQPPGHGIGFLDIPGERSKTRAWKVNDDGTHAQRVVPEQERGQGAGAWSTDGKRFFYWCLDGEIFVRVQAGILGWLRKPVVTRLTASGQLRGQPAVDPANPRRLYAVGSTRRGETVRYDRKARKWVSFLEGFSGEDIDRSPDGQWMVYVTFPGAQLRKCKIDGSGDVLLAPGVYALNPSWSPDGNRIAFPGRPAGSNEDLKLWLVSADGGDAAPYRPVIASGYDTTWSKDGKSILLGQYQAVNSPGESRIKILHLETGTLETIPGGERLFSPHWSPDERQILAVSLNDYHLYIFDTVKRQWRELIKRPIRFPKWSSDGKYIYTGWREYAFRVEVATGHSEEIAHMDFRRIGNVGRWVGWTEEWEPLTLRNFSSTQVYRIDLDR
jgi:DNA-binding winged helix-turn-helix (wHTH) protein/WD40 repeat protein